MPVRRAADIEVFRVGELGGSRLAAPMHSVTGVPAGIAMPPSSTGSTVMRLPSWLELSNRSISSTAVLIMAGFSISRAFCVRIMRQRHQPVADQIGGGLMAGIEQEDAIVQQFLRGQPLAIVLALNEPRQHVTLGIAGFCAPPLDQDFEIAQKILHRLVAARKHLRTDHGLQRAQNGERPVAQRLALVHRARRADCRSPGSGSRRRNPRSVRRCPWRRGRRAGGRPAGSDRAPSPRSRAVTARP